MKLPITTYRLPIKKTDGFSLIELLVVVALMGVIGTIVLQITTVMFRSQGKAELEKAAKQNGDLAMKIIEQTIRDAKDIVDCGSTHPTYITVTNRDNTQTTLSCSAISGQFTKQSIGSGAAAPLPPSPITDTKVRIPGDCVFNVVCPDNSERQTPKYVYVYFSVEQANSAATDPYTKIDLSYQETISLRTYMGY